MRLYKKFTFHESSHVWFASSEDEDTGTSDSSSYVFMIHILLET